LATHSCGHHRDKVNASSGVKAKKGQMKAISRGKSILTTGVAVLGVVTLSAALAAPAQASVKPAQPRSGTSTAWEHGSSQASADAFTTKTPYVPQGSLSSYQPAPKGFLPVFTENVSRHGARTLTSPSEGDSLLALWNIAKSQNALTPLGKGLGPEVQALLAANAKDGYGLLTGSGKQALASTAVRMEQRLPNLFSKAARAGVPNSISVVAASAQRTIDSATSFEQGLESVNPALKSVFTPTQVNDDLLDFHDAAVNQNYTNYVNSPAVADVEAASQALPRTVATSRAMLDLSFTPAFVQRVNNGGYSAEFANTTGVATAIYDLDANAQDMALEGRWTMDRYLTPSEADWFGYLDDVQSFYENGPAFTGSDITTKMANVLLDDMFAQLDAKRDGTSRLTAVLRFTHAEEIFPLAALLQLPGSTKALPSGTLFSYANDPFRGAAIAPMGANIQWDLLKSGSTYLVRMLDNEKQTAFKAGCAPIAKGSYFYNLNELEKCYAWTATSTAVAAG
jgi:hypothetical protein